LTNDIDQKEINIGSHASDMPTMAVLGLFLALRRRLGEAMAQPANRTSKSMKGINPLELKRCTKVGLCRKLLRRCAMKQPGN
jgi:hypothetical protein